MFYIRHSHSESLTVTERGFRGAVFVAALEETQVADSLRTVVFVRAVLTLADTVTPEG